jgi:lactoylglutathione lyase
MGQLLHTCYRIGDIDRSVAFYEALGFEEVGRMPIRDEAINVFMGLPGDGPRLELTYNHGVDGYELGTGYNHIAITAEDLDATLERLAAQGIEPEKPPYRVREGGSRLAFVRDPDGYRIELIETRGGPG